ncbi:MAG: hypothetical protein RIR39_640 [Pseudomonadota bacterium]
MLLKQLVAGMVELVDTLASGASERTLVEVQVLFSVPNEYTIRRKEAQTKAKTRKLQSLAGFLLPNKSIGNPR